MFSSQSKLPITITSIYIVISILAFILMFATMETESLSGIFVVLVAMPWSIFFTQFDIGSTALSAVIMALGVIINAFIIYTIFSFFTRKK